MYQVYEFWAFLEQSILHFHNRLLAPIGPNQISKQKFKINWRAWQYKRISPGGAGRRDRKLTNLKNCYCGIMSFLNNAVVQSCLAWVPIKVLQVSVSNQFHDIPASILYEGKKGKDNTDIMIWFDLSRWKPRLMLILHRLSQEMHNQRLHVTSRNIHIARTFMITFREMKKVLVISFVPL
jgi:hypothetical protein